MLNHNISLMKYKYAFHIAIVIRPTMILLLGGKEWAIKNSNQMLFSISLEQWISLSTFHNYLGMLDDLRLQSQEIRIYIYKYLIFILGQSV
jgi:hypothetical protein